MTQIAFDPKKKKGKKDGTIEVSNGTGQKARIPNPTGQTTFGTKTTTNTLPGRRRKAIASRRPRLDRARAKASGFTGTPTTSLSARRPGGPAVKTGNHDARRKDRISRLRERAAKATDPEKAAKLTERADNTKGRLKRAKKRRVLKNKGRLGL